MFPDFQRARRGLKLCSRLVIKHDLVSNSSVLLSLIFDDTLYFSFCAPFHLFKRCDVIGRTAITMTDGFPGGRSAVAKMISGGEGGGQSALPMSADVRWCKRFILSAKSMCGFFFMQPVWWGWILDRDAGLCLQHLSDLLVMTHTHTHWCKCKRQMRWGDKNS